MNFILLFIILAIAGYLLYRTFSKQKNQQAGVTALPVSFKEMLGREVPFYQELTEEKKRIFEQRVQQFLTSVKITGVKTAVEDIDRVLIAASAIIPIFNFEGWQYINLKEILLYPDAFDHDFKQEGAGRNILGMVGSGAMNNVMILSQFELRQAFTNKTGKSNTAIHEFVHLVDKTDGSIDGIPELILQKQYILPWLKRMEYEIEMIRNNESDIDDYAGTNESEFFAVVSEYFFERPGLLEKKHPELYALLQKIFIPATGN